MLIYALRKLSLLLITLLLLTLLAFLLGHFAPGDPVYKLIGEQNLTPAQYQEVYNAYHLNRPLILQFFRFIGNAVSGDLGISTASGEMVLDQLLRTLPATAELVIYALILAVMAGIPIGTLAALNSDTPLDRTILACCLIGTSIPTFWWALLIILLLSLTLGWLPLSGRISLLFEVEPRSHIMLLDLMLGDMPYRAAALRDALAHLFMPMVAVATIPMTQVIRTTRSTMVRLMREDFIKAARARGLGRWLILRRHALPNVLLPVSRDLSLQFGTLFTGAMIVENIFAWPGVGRYLVSSVQQQDYPALQGCLLLVGSIIVLLSVLSDLLHTAADPLTRKDLRDVG